MVQRMMAGKKMAEIVADKIGVGHEKVVCVELNDGDIALCIMPDKGVPINMFMTPRVRIGRMADRIADGLITAEEAAEMISDSMGDFSNMFLKKIALDKETVLDNCVSVMVPAKDNAVYASTRPYRLLCDLMEMVVIPVPIGEGVEKKGVVYVDNIMMRECGISDEELFGTARKNSARGYVLLKLNDVIGQGGIGGDMLHVLTNTGFLYGAGLLACPEVLKECRERIGEDIYIIPSSVHEILLLERTEDDSEKSLVGIIREVNSTVLTDEDKLSDHLYGIDRDGLLYIVA